MSETNITLAFTGGGTGGHIYPGLAIAARLQKEAGCRIFWIGSDSGMDKSIVEEAGFEFFGIPTGKLRRNFSPKNFTDVFKIAAGFFAARKILRREKPALLFSKGGFVSVPPSAAAASLNIPVFSHESDLTPGLAAKINLRFTEKHFVPYTESPKFYPAKFRGKLEISGNPIRSVFEEADSAKGRAFLGLDENARVLLVLGGSSGSLEINSLVRQNLARLTDFYTVVHQCGSNDNEIPVPGARYRPYPYFHDELPHVLAAAELVICRGGAGTLWECAALGKPMIIIPLKGSGTRGDQVENAELFENAGAAITLDGHTSDKEKIADIAAALASDNQKRGAMAASGIGRMAAAEFIAEKILRKVRSL